MQLIPFDVERGLQYNMWVLGNEFADFLAVGVREGTIAPRKIPRNFVDWFGDTSPKIHSTWLLIDQLHRGKEVPLLADSSKTWTSPTDGTPFNWIHPQHGLCHQPDVMELSVTLTCVQFNVCTLLKPGATAYMREQLSHLGVHIAGLQETRTPSAEVFDSNFIRLVAPAKSGQGGTELWFNKTLPFARSSEGTVHLQRDHLLVLHHEPEALFVRLEIGSHKLLCISAHAPPRSHDTTSISGWWTHFHALFKKAYKHDNVILFIDANASVGAAPPWIGAVADEDFDQAGLRLLALCQEFDLCIPSSFDHLHWGESATWHNASTQNKTTRIDYIVVSRNAALQCSDSWTSDNLDAGHAKVDHIPLYSRFALASSLPSPTQKGPLFDRKALKDATAETWERFFQDWPCIDWSMDVTTHAHILEQHLHRQLQAFFPHRPQHRRGSVFTAETWELHSQRNHLRKQLRAHRHELELWLQWMGLQRLRRLTCTWIPLLNFSIRCAARWKLFRQLSASLQQSVNEDRRKLVDEMVHDLATANPKEISRFMQPLRMGKRAHNLGKKQLPMVVLEDGALATSRQEAVGRWREHFKEMEAGTDTSMAQLQTATPQPGNGPCNFDDIPTIYEVEEQFRKSKGNKATGLDFIPGELLRASPQHMAYWFFPLVQKMSLWCQEPLQFKGGRLAVLHKKGTPIEVSNYRAILVSSALGKSIHNIWRKRTLPWMRTLSDPLQISAQPGALVSQAAHMIRLHLSMCKQRRVSGSILFLDIQSAYYRLLRQHAFGLDCSDEGIFTLLHRMGIRDATIQDVADAITGPTLLEESGCPLHLRQMIKTFHDQTWFLVTGDRRLIETHRGTRPGDGFADVIWNITFAKFLNSVTAKLKATGAFKELGWNQLPGLKCDTGPHTTNNFAVTWADDTAFMGWSPQATSLIPQLQVTVEIVFSELLSLGMRPNTADGKTESIVDLRGPHSLPCRQQLHGPSHSRIPIHIDNAPDFDYIRVVPAYNHLGGYLVHGARHMTEIKRRIAMTLRTLALHRTKIFGNPRIDMAHRVALYKTTAHLTLCYNVGTWSDLTMAELQAWRIGVFKIYRRLLVKLVPPQQQFHTTDLAVLRWTGLPHPDDILHVERLRLFGLSLRRTTPFFWTLVANEKVWLALVRSSFRWLHEQITTGLPPPDEDPDAWHHIILHGGPTWKNMLRRATAHSHGQRLLRADIQAFRRSFFGALAGCGLQIPRTTSPIPQACHPCLLCGAQFATFRGWAVHSFDSHGRLSRFRQLADGSLCQACGKQFPSNFRLVRHFRGSPACAATVAALRSWSSPQPFLGSSSVSSVQGADAMIPWMPSEAPRLQARAGLAMNACQLDLMKGLAKYEWAQSGVVESARDYIKQILNTTPIHFTEVRQAFDAFMLYHAEDEAREQLTQLLDECLGLFSPTLTTQTTSTPPSYDFEHVLDSPDTARYVNVSPTTKGAPRFLYVLHLFSGVKRQGDVHSYIDQMAVRLNVPLCPISVDVALHSTHGDLLNTATQCFWLDKAASGLLFFVICGPPCESWSVSRFRQLLEGTGPRPLRATDPPWALWGKAQLRLRELLQVDFGNRLLQFSLLILSYQLLSGRYGLMEHPACATPRLGLQPPSVWLLPEVVAMLRHPKVRLLQLQQGLFGGISPKPTSFLLVSDPHEGDLMEQALLHGRSQMALPAPLTMGKTSNGYATNPLKRYPPHLCATIARMVGCAVSGAIKTLGDQDDGVVTVAQELQRGYETVKDSTHSSDAADFHH